MAKDLEDGFTRIANEVLEDLARCKLFCVKSRVVLAIIRNTWGWKGHPKERELSATYLAQATGCSVSAIEKALSILNEAEVITREGSVTGYNKHWIPPSNRTDPPNGGTLQMEGVPPSNRAENPPPNGGTKKEKKENRKKEYIPPPPNGGTPGNQKRKVAAPDLFITENMTSIATKAGVKPEEVGNLFEDFKGYYGDEIHTPYKWAFAWRKWCENHIKFGKEKKNGNQSTFDKVAERFLRTVE